MTALVMPVPAGRLRVCVSPHALTRYVERVKPGLEIGAAYRDLTRVSEHGEIVLDPPPWLARTMLKRADLYLQIGDIVFPLRRDRGRPGSCHATTCIARSGLSDLARRRRNLARRWRRAERRRTKELLRPLASTKKRR